MYKKKKIKYKKILFFIIFFISIIFSIFLLKNKKINYKSQAKIKNYQLKKLKLKKNSSVTSTVASACSFYQICESNNNYSYYFNCIKRSLNDNRKKVVITFDDCFFPENVPENYKDRHVSIKNIIDKANELDIPITFFCIGNSLETHKKFFENILNNSDKFELQNHTYSHKDLNQLSKKDIKVEIEKWNNAYYSLNLNNKNKKIYLRPPGMSGVDNKDVINSAKDLGIVSLVGASITSKASVNYNIKSNDIASCIEEKINDKEEINNIILFHPLKQDLEALEIIVKSLKKNNFKFLKLSDFLKI